MAVILGISAFYHDSAAALVVDGCIVAAAQEERFTRIKHDPGFPVRAIAYCLEQAGLTPEQIDYVGFYDKPLLKFDRLLHTYLATAPHGLLSFLKAMPLWMKSKLYLPREIRNGLGGKFTKRIIFAEHHESHAASAFFPSPFRDAAILTIDGVGEWAAASYGVGEDNKIELRQEQQFPHSLGLLYSAFTYYCGFRVNSGEYKLMGLAPYGEPRFANDIMKRMVHLNEDGSFSLDLSYFNFCSGLTMTSSAFHAMFGGPPRAQEGEVGQREMDVAASIQEVTERILMNMVRHIHHETGKRNLCLAGGVALNCVANGRIMREGPFENVWIQPAAGDAGGALGVALFIWHQLLGGVRIVESGDAQRGSLLGPQFDNASICAFLDKKGASYCLVKDESDLCDQVATLIASGHVIGWVQGRMEFGPRALGCRSILGDARSSEMQSVMNLKIKFRESFRPFAPSVLEEYAAEYFQLVPGVQSPYMLLVADVHESQRIQMTEATANLRGMQRLKVRRSEIPAVTHVDYSARVQTVDSVRHGRYYKLLKSFHRITGCPVVVNTSFNVRGEPIVCTPEDAYRCFMGTGIDVLVLENCILMKKDQPTSGGPDQGAYLSQFKRD